MLFLGHTALFLWLALGKGLAALKDYAFETEGWVLWVQCVYIYVCVHMCYVLCEGGVSKCVYVSCVYLHIHTCCIPPPPP